MRHIDKKIMGEIDSLYENVRQDKHIENIADVTKRVIAVYGYTCNKYDERNESIRDTDTILTKIQNMSKDNVKVTATINIFLQDCVTVVTTNAIVNFDTYFYHNNLTKMEGRLIPISIKPVNKTITISSVDECTGLIVKLGLPGVVSLLKLMLMIEAVLYSSDNG